MLRVFWIPERMFGRVCCKLLKGYCHHSQV